MPSNALAFGFLAFLVGMLIMLQKHKMIDLQAISRYALLQIGKLLPCRHARLIHNCHVFEAALVEMFVNLTFESDRRVHSMPPFRESTEDLVSKALVTEEITCLERSTAVAANAIVSKGTGLKRWVSPSSNASARQSIPLLAVKVVLMITSLIARCSNAPLGSVRFP